MKIHCTLKEFELLVAFCPMRNLLMNDNEADELIDKCLDECVLRKFCPYGSDDKEASFADICVIESEVAE